MSLIVLTSWLDVALTILWSASAFVWPIDICQQLALVQYPLDNWPNTHMYFSTSDNMFQEFISASNVLKLANQSWPDCDTVLWLAIELETQPYCSWGCWTPFGNGTAMDSIPKWVKVNLEQLGIRGNVNILQKLALLLGKTWARFSRIANKLRKVTIAACKLKINVKW